MQDRIGYIHDRIGYMHNRIGYMHDRIQYIHHRIGYIQDRIGYTINTKPDKRFSWYTINAKPDKLFSWYMFQNKILDCILQNEKQNIFYYFSLFLPTQVYKITFNNNCTPGHIWRMYYLLMPSD